MSTIKCNNCGLVFEDTQAEREIEHFHAWGGHQTVSKMICPDCKSDEVEEVEKCKICGEILPDEDMHFFGVCNRCTSAIGRDIKETYNEAQRETIKYLFEKGEL